MLVGLLALAAALAASAGVSAAATATISPAGNITAGTVNTLTFSSGGFTFTCPFTLAGTLAGSAVGSVNTDILVGAIASAASPGSCVGANSLRMLTFPWNALMRIILNANGTITITRRIRGFQWLFDIPIAGSCLFAGDIDASATIARSGATVGSLSIDQTQLKASGGILCPTNIGLRGTIGLPLQTMSIAL